MSAALSGRVEVVENQISFLNQQILQRPDLSAFSQLSINWNNQLDSMEEIVDTMRLQMNTLQNLYTNFYILFKEHTGIGVTGTGIITHRGY